MTLEGMAIKALYIMEYERPAILEVQNLQSLNLDQYMLRLFIEQLAGLGKAAA